MDSFAAMPCQAGRFFDQATKLIVAVPEIGEPNGSCSTKTLIVIEVPAVGVLLPVSLIVSLKFRNWKISSGSVALTVSVCWIGSVVPAGNGILPTIDPLAVPFAKL